MAGLTGMGIRLTPGRSTCQTTSMQNMVMVMAMESSMMKIDRNIRHYLYTNPYYEPQDLFPAGPEIELTSRPMAPNGQIKDIGIRAGIDFDNVLGLAYEIDFDTSIYTLNEALRIPICPARAKFLPWYVRPFSKILRSFSMKAA